MGHYLIIHVPSALCYIVRALCTLCIVLCVYCVCSAEAQTYPALLPSHQEHRECLCTACSTHGMKPNQEGNEETTLHLCRHHKVLHIPGAWRSWPSATCCCLSMLENGGSLLGTMAFCLDAIGAQLVAALCGLLLISAANDSR